jgi:hypothetical protein
MAAGTLPTLGSTYGPCEEVCQHTDCAATRTQAASLCTDCGEPIGYDRRFYQADDWKRLIHAACAER